MLRWISGLVYCALRLAFVVLGWFAWVADLVGLLHCVLRFGLVVLV